MDFKKINFISQKFFINTKVLNIEFINSGLINKTYIIEHLYNGKKSKFILQSLSNLFESKQSVNMNHKLITDHINFKITNTNSDFDLQRWEVPNLILCKFNNLFGFPFESDFWRAMVYIDESFSVDFLEDELMAYQTGIGLAKFHLICSDLDSSKLKTNIKNFHNIKYYIDQFEVTLKDYKFIRFDDNINKRIHDLINSLSCHIGYVKLLLRSLNNKSIDNNIIHGDPKLSNFLFDNQYKYVVSLIDLDTVSSGYFLTDLADCIRSICNLSGEDPKCKEDVSFDIDSCISFLKGYFSIINEKNNYSFKFLLEFTYLLIFELTIRFFTDFLQSNSYFKIKYETHNLFRAEVQYRLLSSFLAQIHNLSYELNGIGIYSDSTFVSDVQNFV